MPAPEPKPPKRGPLVDSVAEWLMAQALSDPDLDGLFEGCCARLLGAGIPITRGHVAFRTLHPLYASMMLTWRRQGGLERQEVSHAVAERSEDWRRSPLYHLIETGIPFLRRRLSGREALLDFPVLAELREAGATDYLAYLVPFDEDLHNGIVGSWTTDRPGGFSDRQIRSLMRIQVRLAVAFKVKVVDQIARNVTVAYLGPRTGSQVLSGSIKRGDGRTIRAALWYSDLRNSTGLAELLPVDAFLSRLNDYFECAAGAVAAHGGEVLALIGDAVLAIFPASDGAEGDAAACGGALDAATDALARLDGLNRGRPGEDALAFGVGLHLGQVVYGNIGTQDRLDFTVVGTAVNEVVRIEALTKSLARPLLASRAFAEAASGEWECLGTRALKGLSGDREIFAAADGPGRGAGGPGKVRGAAATP
jgi:adenylate cyclase